MSRRVVAAALATAFLIASGCANRKDQGSSPSAKPGIFGWIRAKISGKQTSGFREDIPIRVLFFESGAVGKSVKPDGSIEEVTDTFTPTDHLYVSIKSYVAPTGLAANMEITRAGNQPVVASRTEFSESTMRGVFTVNDMTGWPPGDFHIKVFLQGETVFEHDIHVVAR